MVDCDNQTKNDEVRLEGDWWEESSLSLPYSPFSPCFGGACLPWGRPTEVVKQAWEGGS